MKVLFIGDIVGNTGRKALKATLPHLKSKYNPHIIIANGENAAAGRGINANIAKEFFDQGVHGLTMGNHTWDNKEIFDFIDDEPRMVRPANYPPGTPGQGFTVIKAGGKELAVVNLMGRTFLPAIDDPFRAADEIVSQLSKKHKCILVDFHAEATSEKIAMGWHLDGRASCRGDAYACAKQRRYDSAAGNSLLDGRRHGRLTRRHSRHGTHGGAAQVHNPASRPVSSLRGEMAFPRRDRRYR